MSMGNNAWIGFDVGGQSAKAVLLGAEGRILGEAKHPTGLQTDRDRLVSALAGLGLELSKGAPSDCRIAETLGVGIAGVMSSDGVLAGSPNLPSLRGTRVADALSESLRRPVVVDNDANCAAVAEGWRGGAADGVMDFLLLTLGSGIGSGLVLDGELYHGATGYACELGHTIIVAGGRICGCGNRGCLEAYVSERAARALAAEAGGDLASDVDALVSARGWGHAHALFALASAGDRAAAGVADEMICKLGAGLGSAINLLDVPTLVLGGGIAPAVMERQHQLRAAIQATLFARAVETVELLAARRGSDAGAVGAARLAMLADTA